MNANREDEVRSALLGLDAWLETMRGPDGYGGPVAHWWQNCLQFTGAGLDWRYEGIIIGYLDLYRKTRDERWRAKALRAGDDLLRGQLVGGNFRNSCFEMNPYSGGTPHEAACDLALLCLAEALREGGDPAWRTYLAAAERNIREYYIARLWDSDARVFSDHPQTPSFVPNKSATLAEALLKLARLTGDEVLVETYALPTFRAILAHQVHSGPLDGAIYQHSRAGRPVHKFFPHYIARCVPALLAGYEWVGNGRYLDAARRAMDFVMRCQYDDGSFPQVVYSEERMNCYPQWIAAAGDILRALALLAPYDFAVDTEPTLHWLLQGQTPAGGFRTARGFAAQAWQHPPGVLPEFRDLLPVAGWNSMAFRYLASVCQDGMGLGDSPAAGEPYEVSCTLRTWQMAFAESETEITLQAGPDLLYHWRKGREWADICAPELLCK
jgi:hypothetical protein